MSGYRFERLRVLVVDDNPHMRKLVITILQAFGVVQITEAGDGDKAWAVMREANPDVVFLDWMMDGLNGLEVAKLIRTSPLTPNPFVPIIMLTGYTTVDKVRLARDAGINEFLAKPVSVKAVMSRLVSVIEQPRPYVRTKAYFGPCLRRLVFDEYRGPDGRMLAAEYIFVAAAS